MNPEVAIYHCSNKHQDPSKHILDSDKNITISENDYIHIEIRSSVILPNECFVWLSDYKFTLSFVDNRSGYFVYSVNLNSFFDNEDALKFSHRFLIDSISLLFHKVFLNYYGECSIELEGFNDINSITEVGKVFIDSDKINDIDSLLNYLLLKDHYYWNIISLTKVEANDLLLHEENIIWTLKKLENSVAVFEDKILPYLSDPIGILIPKYDVRNFENNSVVTEESLLWLIENCNVLEPSHVYEENSFLILNRSFHVNELLVQSLETKTDVIENQVIHGYLNDVFDFLNQSLFSIEKLLNKIKLEKDFKTQIYRSYYQRLKFTITNLQSRNLNIKNSINLLIPVTREHLNLSGSNRFESKQHYFEAYLLISNWITRKDALFSPEKLFSGAKDISKLYEIFCLFKIIDTLSKDFGLSLVSSENAQAEFESQFEIFGTNSTALNSKYIFIHTSTESKITLYYELLPEKLTTVAKGVTKGYRPDFIFEIERKNSSSYIIMDAKYKKIGTIQNFDYQELTLKYAHGIGLKTGGLFPLLGLFILNPIENSQISYYQKKEFSITGSQPSLPIIGRIEVATTPNDNNYLNQVLSKVLGI